MTYLHRYIGFPGPATPTPHPWLKEGLAVGALGGAAVAVWFLALDLMTRVAFYTPAALGSVFFFGAESAQDIRHDFVTIGGYTLLHFAVFMALGALFLWLVHHVQSGPHRWLIAVMSFIMLDGLFAGTVAALGAWIIATIGVWAIVVGNIIAIAVMGAAVWATHPVLRQEFTNRPPHPAI